MKRVFSNNRLIMVAFFTVFSIATGAAAVANEPRYDLPVELKLIGSIKEQPLLQLSFAGNAQENEFTIIIRDEAGNSLYRENIKGENFYKKFLLNNDNADDNIVRFEITGKRSNKTVVFEVNRHTHLVEELVVSKMD